MAQKTYFEQVGDFHEKFGFPRTTAGTLPKLLLDEQADIAEFRRKFLEEELKEFIRAQENNDLVEIADALVDLVYVALGTAHWYGLPFDELFDEVQRSNMEKVRVRSKDEYKGRSEWDVAKPADWQPPQLAVILAKKFFSNYMPQE